MTCVSVECSEVQQMVPVMHLLQVSKCLGAKQTALAWCYSAWRHAQPLQSSPVLPQMLPVLSRAAAAEQTDLRHVACKVVCVLTSALVPVTIAMPTRLHSVRSWPQMAMTEVHLMFCDAQSAAWHYAVHILRNIDSVTCKKQGCT